MQPSRALAACAAALLAATSAAQREIQTHLGSVVGSNFGQHVRSLGDVDGDGAGDFAVAQPESSGTLSGPGRIFVFSGRSGASLSTMVGSTANGNWGLAERDLPVLGDVDGDGHPDFAAGYVNRGNMDVFSGRTGSRLYRLGASPEFHQYACDVGDLDGDGMDDFAAFVRIGSNNALWLMRGVSGTQLGSFSGNPAVAPMRTIGDITGDGRPEFAVFAGSLIQVYRTNPPQLLRTIQINAGSQRHLDAIDIDGDGRRELLAGYRGIVHAYDPATGMLVRSYTLPPDDPDTTNGHFALIEDLNADGVDELALGGASFDPIHTSIHGKVVFLCGRTGARLGVWHGSPRFRGVGVRLVGLGDVDGDGFGDFVTTSPFEASTGGWQTVSGKILAGSANLPVNCHSGAFPPTLGVSRPVLGRTVTIAGRDAPPGTMGTLALSRKPVAEVNLGVVGCDVWFDLTNWSILFRPPPTSSWSLTIPVPNAPQLAGTEIALQAFYLPTATPLGFDLSTGVWARIGH